MNDDHEDPLEDARERIVRAVVEGAEIPTDAFDILTEDLMEIDVVSTYLNVVDRLPSIHSDWWWEFGEGLMQPTADEEGAGDADDEEADEDEGPSSVSDSDLLALARSWVDYVRDNDVYRWDYPDYSIARVVSRGDEVWLVLLQDWDAGAEQDLTLVDGFRTEKEAEARISHAGFVDSSDVTISDAIEMR